MTITDFLLARIAEDEAVARAVSEPLYPSASFVDRFGSFDSDWSEADGEHVERHNPARVLEECRAKRAIMELCLAAPQDGWETDYGAGLLDAVYQLASVYADHPDYRQEWALSEA